MRRRCAIEELLTTREAARLLGKAPRTVRGYIERGLLPVARQVNPRLALVYRGDVERLLTRLAIVTTDDEQGTRGAAHGGGA